MRIKKSFNVAILVGIAALVMAFSSCGEDSPENVVAVQDFKLDNYLGKWYEIARLDFKHEKDMSNVTAEYYLNDSAPAEKYPGLDGVADSAQKIGESGKGTQTVSAKAPDIKREFPKNNAPAIPA